MSSINLTHHFLIAMPNMADPYFSRTLTYICEHNDQGALGLVVNRPIEMTLSALLERLSLPISDAAISGAPIYFGGPVGPPPVALPGAPFSGAPIYLGAPGQPAGASVLPEPVGNWQATLAVR